MGELSTGALFVSYSRADVDAVRALVERLEHAGEDVFLDLDMHGGDAWWDTILRNIRECRVFVVAVSQSSLDSTPCQLELGYARSLGLPILPLQVGEVSSFRTDKVFHRQLIDFRPGHDTPMTPYALTKALKECSADRTDLPDPLPVPPSIPYEYIQVLADKIKSRETIPQSEQIALFYDLRKALNEEQEESVRDDVRALLLALRGRTDVYKVIADDIARELGLVEEPRAEPEVKAPAPESSAATTRPPQQPPASPPGAARPAGWLPDPGGSTRLRYWDGVRWTNHYSEVARQPVQPLRPAGWYPDSANPRCQRYWNGSQWTNHYSPVAGAAAPVRNAAVGGAAAVQHREAPQPPPTVGRPHPVAPATRPDSGLVLAFVVTALCCLPFGLVAILNATQVNKLWDQGEYDEARKKAALAKTWTMWAAIGGLVVLIVAVGLQMVDGGAR